MKSLLHSLYWLSLILICFALILFFWIPNTQAGSRWIVKKGIHITGLPLQLDQFNGTLGKRFGAEKLVYRTDALVIEIVRPSIDWRPAALLRKKLRVQSLSATQVNIEILQQADKEQTSDAVLPEFSLPVAVFLDDLRLGSLKRKQNDQTLDRIYVYTR